MIRSLDHRGTFQADLFDARDVRELLPALRAGQFGMSDAPAGVIRGELTRRPPESDFNPKRLPQRTLRQVEHLREVSIVAFPADERTSVTGAKDAVRATSRTS